LADEAAALKKNKPGSKGTGFGEKTSGQQPLSAATANNISAESCRTERE